MARDRRSLMSQIRDEVHDKLRIGESKHLANKNGDTGGIYSWTSYKTVKEQAQQFGRWCRETHGCKTFRECEKHIEGYLERKQQTCSSATVKTYASSIAKAYGKSIKDFDIEFEKRTRDDITRSRNKVEYDKHFRGDPQIENFCKHTGVRSRELANIKPTQLKDINGQYYLKDVKGKGGKVRDIKILNNDIKTINLIKERTGSKNIFTTDELKKVNDIHGLRREYAQELYKSLERDMNKLDRSEKYYCRADKAGTIYDRVAMKEVSENLGHNRIEVIARHYL